MSLKCSWMKFMNWKYVSLCLRVPFFKGMMCKIKIRDSSRGIWHVLIGVVQWVSLTLEHSLKTKTKYTYMNLCREITDETKQLFFFIHLLPENFTSFAGYVQSGGTSGGTRELFLSGPLNIFFISQLIKNLVQQAHFSRILYISTKFQPLCHLYFQ